MARATGGGAVANTVPDPGAQLGFAWKTGPRLGAPQTLAAYGSSPWLRAFTSKIGGAVAGLTWRAYVATDTRGRAIQHHALQRSQTYAHRQKMYRSLAAKDQLREIPDHPAIAFLSAGNRYFGGHVTMELTSTHLDLVGEACWLMNLNALDRPVEAMPIPPTWVTKTPSTPDGDFQIMGPTGLWNVPAKYVFFPYHPDPANPYRRGLGIGQVLGDEIETDEFAAKHTKDWFRNRAIPPVLITGLGLALPELQRLEEKWLARFSRQGRGWLPQFLGRDVDVHQLSQTFEQMQLTELRVHERDTIRQVYGIPPESVGIIAPGASRATIEVADYIWNAHVICPRAEFLRSAFQQNIAPRYDERIILDYDSPIAEDRAFQLEVRKAAPWGWELDEWREFGGSEPLPAGRGKIVMVPIGMVPTHVTELGDTPPAPETTPPAGPEGTYTEIDAPETPALNPAVDDAPAEQPAKVTAITAHTKGPIGPRDFARIAAAADWRIVSRAGRPVIEAAIKTFGNEVIEDAGLEIDFNLRDPRVEQHIRQWALDRIRDKVNETTRSAVAETLADGTANGETFKQLTERIQDVFADASDARAALIARTEITRSTGFANEEGLRQAGFEEKAWLSTRDNHVRDTHIELDGQVVAINANFVIPSTLAEAPYPGAFNDPGEDCNCRCQCISALVVRRMPAAHRAQLWRQKDAAREAFVRRLRVALRGAFREQEAAVIAALAEAAGVERGRREPAWQRRNSA